MILSLCNGCDNQSNIDINDEFSDRLVTEKQSILSPSEKYILEMIASRQDNVRGFHFIVKNSADNNEIFRSEEFFRLRDVNYLFWEDDDVIWAYSGDVGTFYWEKSNNTWEKKSYYENKDEVETPEILKQLRPKRFN